MKINKVNVIPNLKKVLRNTSSKNYNCTNNKYLLPIVTVPLLAYNLLGTRNALLVNYCTKAINEQKKLLNDGKITTSEFNKRVQKIKDYYKEAKELDADVSAQTIQSGEPVFKGDSDYSVYDGSNDDGCCDCDSDDSCGSDSDDCCDCDSDCDSGDTGDAGDCAAASSY